jgi:hypothetical protein
MSSEPDDLYADQFQLVVGPFGSTLNFAVSDPEPPAPGIVPQPHRIASVRMSVQHLKAMAFLIAKQVKKFERDSGTATTLPIQVLNQMAISPEDWNTFWRLD